MATAPALRGKAAEGLLKTHLEKRCIQQDTTFYRPPDMRAGSKQPALADFLLLHKGEFHLLECKEVDHAYRLPHGNFDEGQVGRMRLWKLAGAHCLVLIYHTPLKLWRGYDIDRFISRIDGGSWDLRDTEPKTLNELLK